MSKKLDSTTKDKRYLGDEEKFLKFSHLGLASHFANYKSFLDYYKKIDGEDDKALFLRTASFYLFLVKRGDWIVDIPNSAPKVDYITNTYKYVTIFSLIESLSKEKFSEFYKYLLKKEFPIKDKKQLKIIYDDYKMEFGSINRCISFFRRLSPDRQRILISKLEVKGANPSIESLARFLYELRSKFVHEAELVHHMSSGMSVGRKGRKLVVCKLSIQDAMEFFEEGLIAHFKTGIN